jgi:hypothetical protein
MLDSGLLEVVRHKLYLRVFDEFVDATRQADDAGENSLQLALAAARRRDAVDDVIGEVMKLAKEAEKHDRSCK